MVLIQDAEEMAETTQDDIYANIQSLFQRGLVIVVGSGASSAYGLPGMPALADYLLTTVPSRGEVLDDPADKEWEIVASALQSGKDLESALSTGVSEKLADLLTELITEHIRDFESKAISQILAASEVSPFGRMLIHAMSVTPALDVVTTNYDRLVEVHAARAGLPVDTMYFGHTIGRLNAQRSRDEMLRGQTVAGRPQRTTLATWPHVRLSKPHGSLDWFSHGEEHYRTDLAVPGSRSVIAPGGNKYRLGYDAPFDAQRERANRAIDQAAALLFIGYGFNDEHLQTHLRPRFANVPAVVLSRTLTAPARDYLGTNSAAIGIQSSGSGCTVYRGASELALDIPLWNLESLTKEVLGL